MWNEADKKIDRLPYREIKAIAPAGAIVSNATDMAQWLRLMLGKGEFEGKRLISEASYDKITAVHQNVAGNVNYGYGWFLRDWNGHKVVEHGGNIDGFNAAVALMPDQHLGFALLTNVTASPLGSQAMSIVWDNLVGSPKSEASQTAVSLNPEKEIGTYFLKDANLQCDVTFKDGKLYAFPKGQINLPLIPRGGRKYEIGPPAPPKIFVSFRAAKDNPSETEVVLEQSGQTFVGGRIDSNKPKTEAKFDAGISVDELMAKIVEASGGEEALRRHRTLRFTSVTELLNQGMSIHETVVMQAPNRVSKEQVLVAVGKKVGHIHEYFDGASGGQENDFTASSPIAADKIAETAVSADFYPDLNWKKLYKSVVILKKDKVGDEEAYVVEKLISKDNPVREYISVKNFRLLKRETSTAAPGAAPVSATETYSDYRNIGGVWIPFVRTGSQGGSGEFVTTLKEVRWDGPVTPSLFQKK